MKILLILSFLVPLSASAQWEYIYSCKDNGWKYSLEKVQKSYDRVLHNFNGKNHGAKRILCYKVANSLNKLLVKLKEGEQKPILKCRTRQLIGKEIVDLVSAAGEAEGDQVTAIAFITSFDGLAEQKAECESIVKSIGRI